jgi:uncharacterized protein (TIGR02246 family)
MSTLTAEDRAEITELFARYAWAGDTGDVEAYVDLFTDNGVFDGVMGYFEGRAGLVELVEGMVKGPRSRGIQHWVSNSVFDGDGERCTVKSMCFAPRRIENEHSIVFVGYYVDTCVKVDGRWRFEVRRWRPWQGDVVRGAQPWLTGDDDGGYLTRADKTRPDL